MTAAQEYEMDRLRQLVMNLQDANCEAAEIIDGLRAENASLRDSLIGPMIAAQHVHERLKPESAFPERIP